MFYTYVLQSLIDKKFYTGHTNNLQRKLKEHSEGKNFSTKHRRPFVLIFYEACLNQNDAIQREKYLKTGIGKRFLKQRLKNFLENQD